MFQTPTEQVIYQADPGLAQTLRAIRERVHSVGRQFVNRRVRVTTIDGQTYEGIIATSDGRFLYLRVPRAASMPRAFPGHIYDAYYYNTVILPLVLFELLVIVLLYG